jgi:hypothetical protein
MVMRGYAGARISFFTGAGELQLTAKAAQAATAKNSFFIIIWNIKV